MTTGIAIKCNDGVVLASDSQGTENDGSISSLPATKVFEINKNMGLVGAGYIDQINKLLQHFKKIPDNWDTKTSETFISTSLYGLDDDPNKQHPESPDNFNEQKLIEDYLNSPIRYLNKMENNQAFLPGYTLESNLYFSPQVLIGIKSEKKFYIYNGIFGLLEPNSHRKIVAAAIPIENSGVIGSGTNWARMRINDINDIHLKKLNNGIHGLTTNINVGIAMHVINYAIKYDQGSGGDFQIGIINKDKFRIIPVEEHEEYYRCTIKSLSKLLEKNESEIKDFLPVSITTLF